MNTDPNNTRPEVMALSTPQFWMTRLTWNRPTGIKRVRSFGTTYFLDPDDSDVVESGREARSTEMQSYPQPAFELTAPLFTAVLFDRVTAATVEAGMIPAPEPVDVSVVRSMNAPHAGSRRLHRCGIGAMSTSAGVQVWVSPVTLGHGTDPPKAWRVKVLGLQRSTPGSPAIQILHAKGNVVLIEQRGAGITHVQLDVPGAREVMCLSADQHSGAEDGALDLLILDRRLEDGLREMEEAEETSSADADPLVRAAAHPAAPEASERSLQLRVSVLQSALPGLLQEIRAEQGRQAAMTGILAELGACTREVAGVLGGGLSVEAEVSTGGEDAGASLRLSAALGQGGGPGRTGAELGVRKIELYPGQVWFELAAAGAQGARSFRPIRLGLSGESWVTTAALYLVGELLQDLKGRLSGAAAS